MKIKTLKHLIIGLTIFALGLQPAFAAGFSDLAESHTNYAAIMDLQERGIIEGYSDGTFKPDQTINRVETLKIVLLGANIDQTDTKGTADFTDTAQGEWYTPFLTKAVEMKIVDGYPDGTFKPSNVINLVEALKIVQLSYDIDLSGIDVTDNPYADAFAGQWYAPYIQYSKDKNLIESDQLNKVYPDQGMTRGNLAEIIYRLLTIQENDLEIYGEEIVVKPEEPVTPKTFTWNINIDDSRFTPKTMTVGLGSTIKWTNNDSVDHTVTGTDFNSGTMESGDTFEYTFSEIGTFDFHCELHPSMIGSITVKPANEVPTI